MEAEDLEAMLVTPLPPAAPSPGVDPLSAAIYEQIAGWPNETAMIKAVSAERHAIARAFALLKEKGK